MTNYFLNHKIETELVKRLYQPLIYVVWAETAVALAWMAAVWTVLDHTFLVGWFLFRLALCSVPQQLLATYYYRLERADTLNHRKANQLLAFFMLTTLVSGISWGLTCSLLMVPNDLLRESLEVFLIIGVTAIITPYLSAFRSVYAIFLTAAFTPLAVWFMQQGGIFVVLSLLCFVYMGVMLTCSFYINNILVRSLRLRFENQSLLESLANAFSQLDKHSEQVEMALSLVKSTLESTSNGMMVLDAHNRVTEYNEKFVKMWGVSADLLETNEPFDAVFNYLQAQLVNPEEFRDMVNIPFYCNMQKNFRLKDGRIFEIYSRPLIVSTQCIGRVWSFDDASDHVQLEEKLYTLANFDLLSGLPNRVLAMDRLTQAMVHAQNDQKKVAVMFLDLDGFKSVNDTLGHGVGDKVLNQVARRLKKCIRENDTVSREGGDEFLMVLNSLHEESDAINAARKCLATIQEPYIVDGNEINLLLSIGISFYPRDGKEAPELIAKADRAMYRAKELGGNQFQFFTEEMNIKAQNRLAIENQLREAMAKQAFYLEYQAIASLRTGRIIGVEAILHWDHPLFGQVPPEEFMPIAEQSGLIVAMGAWALRTACQQVKTWQRQFGMPLQLSINVYARQFRHNNYDEQIHLILMETGFDPSSLLLEVSEDILLDNLTHHRTILSKIKKMGVMIVMDDFGTGYSSFNYLKQLPVDKLKIDSVFIENLSVNASLISSMIALGGPLHLQVIAEGVTAEEQLIYLLHHGCDEIQGDYFAKPMRAEELTNLLAENKRVDIPEIAE